MLAGICFFAIGIFIGFIFTLFLINFDGKWKLLLEGLIGVGGSGISIFGLFSIFEITEQSTKYSTTTAFILGILISIIFTLFIMCNLIKDKDDTDLLRIRDILLGQKSYIEKYYENRKAEIDNKNLSMPMLEKKSKELSKRECVIIQKENSLNDEENRITELGRKRLKLILPDDKSITLTKEFLDLMPSYLKDTINCILDIKCNELTFLDYDNADLSSLKAYLISLSTSISTYIL